MITIKFQANTADDLRQQILDYLGQFGYELNQPIKGDWSGNQGLDESTPKVETPSAPVASTPVQSAPVAPVTKPAPVAPVQATAPVTPPEPVTVQAPTQASAPVAPTAPVKEYTIEEIQASMAPLMDAGRTNELVGLMQKYGVAALPDLPKEKYPDLANDLRAMGARI